MTEQEAEAFGARLARIWGLEFHPDCDPLTQTYSLYASLEGSVEDEDLVEPEILCVWVKNTTITLFSDFVGYGFTAERGQSRLIVHPDPRPGKRNVMFEFEKTWLDYFRRGCWLSGLPIEASAHEKAEWIQGFTQEEIESWNLKF